MLLIRRACAARCAVTVHAEYVCLCTTNKQTTKLCVAAGAALGAACSEYRSEANCNGTKYKCVCDTTRRDADATVNTRRIFSQIFSIFLIFGAEARAELPRSDYY